MKLFDEPRPKSFRPPTDIPQEKWLEPVSQKGGKRPKWKVVVQDTVAPEKKVESKNYRVSPNYKGKNPMTRTQWRRHQRKMQATRKASESQLKPVEASSSVEEALPEEATRPLDWPIPKVCYPKCRLTKEEKVIANQRFAVRVAPLGDTELVATQNVGYNPTTEYTPASEGEEEEPDYEPSPEDGMVDVDDTYGEDFIINCGIVSILPTEFDRVS